MAFPNVFQPTTSQALIDRINNLNPETPANWGKMNVAQMLAHCNVTYDMVYTDKYPKPNAFMKFILKLMVKSTVVNEVPYQKNGRTAPAFLITDERVFDAEKKKLVNHINKVLSEGESSFENRESHSFGPLNAQEWNNMFYKHLDHHLTQFGV